MSTSTVPGPAPQPVPAPGSPGSSRSPGLPAWVRTGVAAVLVGVAAGLVGVALTWLLEGVELVAFGHGSSLLERVAGAPAWRRVGAPAVVGVLVGLAWWWLRGRARLLSVEAAIAEGRRLPWWSTLADACLQIVVVGGGASLGREGAPRQLAAAAAEHVARWCRVDERGRRVLLAAAAGAGLAAVYDVPLAGPLFAAEIVLGAWGWPVLALGLLASAVGVAVSWPVVHHPTYVYDDLSVPWSLAWFALACVPVGAALGLGFRRLAASARDHAPSVGWRLPVGTGVAGLLVGTAALRWPELMGNGKDALQEVLASPVSLGLLAVLLVAKPLLTSAHLRGGAMGGLLTPAMATGGALGAIVAVWTGQPVGPFALVGAAAVLAVSQRAWAFATVFTLELTHAPLLLGVPIVVACLGSWWVARAVERRWFAPRRPTPTDTGDVDPVGR